MGNDNKRTGLQKSINKNKDKYLALKPSQLKKLELLTIADMASKSSHVEYAEIMHKLQISDIR